MTRLAARYLNGSSFDPTTGNDDDALGLVDRGCRWLLLGRLRALEHGRLRIEEDRGTTVVGSPAADGLEATIRVREPRYHRRVVRGGSMGAAESYIDGDWTSDDPVAVVRLFARNLEALDAMNGGPARVARWIGRLGHRLARNTRAGSRRNIAAHYDLGNEFFRLFLDERMMYSSALYESPDATLEEASVTKLDRICRRLELSPEDHVVEIGTGWGGFAMHAAREYGCRVTTTTISAEQYRHARNQVAAAGLDDRITVHQDDYRDLGGRYDKLVSIEMIEAVGLERLPGFFDICNRLLRPGGAMLVQAITMPESRFDSYARSADFIQRYVFPGGCLPSVAVLQRAVGAATPLRLVSLEDFGADYARTLHEWRRRFHAEEAAVRRLGFDDRFLRLWDYYLSYCEAAFLERVVGVAHLVWWKSEFGTGVDHP